MTSLISRVYNKPLPSPPSTPNKTVNFHGSQDSEKKREKFLTAKYGTHQMALIRKRLRVEMWMYDQLQILYKDVSKLQFAFWQN